MEQNQNHQTNSNPNSRQIIPQKFNFTGSFGQFFLYALGLFVLSVFTFGFALPYFIYWLNKYFFSNLALDGKKVIFKGSFGDYFIMSLGLFFLSVITLGLALPYWIYWNGKYFSSQLELEQ